MRSLPGLAMVSLGILRYPGQTVGVRNPSTQFSVHLPVAALRCCHCVLVAGCSLDKTNTSPQHATSTLSTTISSVCSAPSSFHFFYHFLLFWHHCETVWISRVQLKWCADSSHPGEESAGISTTAVCRTSASGCTRYVSMASSTRGHPMTQESLETCRNILGEHDASRMLMDSVDKGAHLRLMGANHEGHSTHSHLRIARRWG